MAGRAAFCTTRTSDFGSSGLGVNWLCDSDSPLNLVFSHQGCCCACSSRGYPVVSTLFGTYAACDSDTPSNFAAGRIITTPLELGSGRSTGFGVN